MNLFGLKKKKQVMLDDEYTVRFELAAEFKPETNSDVKEALQLVSEGQRQNNEPAVEDTWPFATFQAAETFFQQLKEVVNRTSKPIKFSYFAIWTYDNHEKYRPGKPGADTGNPHEYISLNEFEIAFDYQNFTKPLFEGIFNDPANEDASYDEKKDACQELGKFYQQKCGVGSNEIAVLPAVDEVEKGAVTLDVPALVGMGSPADKPAAIYDPTSASFIQPQANAPVADQPHQAASQTPQSAIRTAVESGQAKPLPKEAPKPAPAPQPKPAPATTAARKKRKTQRSINDQVADEQNMARAKGHLEAPQFPIEELDPVDPGKHGYVEYQLNQKRKTYNKSLQVAAEKISEQNEKIIVQRREAYRKAAEKQVREFEEAHKDDNENLFKQIEKQIRIELNQAIDAEAKRINEKANEEVGDAQRAFEQHKQQILADAEANKHESSHRLTEEYDKKAQQRFKEAGAKLDKQNFTALGKLRSQLDRKYELKAREDANQLRIDGANALEKIFNDCSRQLDKFRTNVTNEHLNAKQTLIAENRSETEKKRIEAPFDEIREINKEVADLKSRLAAAEANSNSLQQANVDLQQRLNAKEGQLESLRHEHESLKNQQISAKINENNQQSNENINDFLKLMMAQQLGNQQHQLQQPAPAPQQAEATNQTNAVNEEMIQKLTAQNKRQRRSMIATIVVGLALMGGLGSYTVYQNKVNSNQTTTVNQKSKDTAQKASTSTTLSQDQINLKALSALHENNLTKLNKYSAENYYQLDKAIIENNAEEANQAVQAMGDNLKMDDRYRASQAEALLKQANNSALADKVAQANQ